MKSNLLRWRALLQGDAIEPLVIAARAQATAELTKVGAVDASVMTFRVYRSGANATIGRQPEPQPFELELCIEYRTEIPLADWIKGATLHVQVGEGPGKLTIEEVTKP